MKKLIFAAIVALAGWFNTQAQSLPTPEKYISYIEQVYELANTDQKKAEFLMNATMEAMSEDAKAYRQVMELAERRFSDPADPIHNEGLYMVVLKHAAEKYILSGAEKERQRLLLEGAKKNMIGSVAADFDYITPKDKTARHLKDLKADYILVYFNNPDCESCETVKERLASNELINQLVNDKKLIVLAVYPYEDQKLWKKAKYPNMMINGWNQSHSIEYGELYDLPTLPCFYLMDKDFTVLVKNEGSLNKVEAKLKSLTAPVEEQPVAKQPAPKAEKPVVKGDASDLKKEMKKKMDQVEQTESKTTAPQAKAPQTSAPQTQAPAPKPTIIPAPADDPNTARSEHMLNCILENKGQELYDNMAESIKSQVQPNSFDGALAQIESQMGKYQSHEPWEIRDIMGRQAYTSVMNFEKAQLVLLIVYDDAGKMQGFSLVPAQALPR